MRYLITLFLLASISIATAQQRFDVTMRVEGIDREFIVSKPTGAVPSGGYPVVFMFHGTTDSGEVFYLRSGWREKGEQEKFITVFPSSLKYCVIDDGVQTRTTKWHSGDLEEAACPGQTLANDVLFVRMMVDTIAATFDIDRSRIYATGFSNGGYFVSKLAVEASDIFAAIAASAGHLHANDSATPRRNIPIIYTVGSKDDRFTTPSGVSEFPMNDSIFRVTAYIFNRYLRTFSLTNDYTSASTPLVLTYTFTTPVPGTNASRFTFVLIDDMGHIYPNGTNYPISSADHYWTFFSAIRSSIDEPNDDDRSTVAIYPNPSSQSLHVRGTERSHLVLRNVMGERVLETAVDGEKTISISSLPAGLYFAEIRNGSVVTVTPVTIQR